MLEELRHDLWLTQRAARAAAHFRRVPEQMLGEIFPGIDERPIRIDHHFEPRGLPYGEAYVLSLIAAHLQPRRVFEIGTGTGGSTLLMANQAPAARFDTLDLGAGDSSLGVQTGDEPLAGSSAGRLYRDSSHADRITQHLGDSATFDFSPFHGEMDLVLVDGAHTFEYAASDSENAIKMLAPGGVIVWDDCALYHAGVPRALVRLVRAGHQVERIVSTRFAVMVDPRTPAHSARRAMAAAPA